MHGDSDTVFTEIPRFSDDLEAIIADLECELLASLTPEQFSAVQTLVEATRLLTEAQAALDAVPTTGAGAPADPASHVRRYEALPTRTGCAMTAL